MSLTVFYTDLRNRPSKLERQVAGWQPGLTAFQAVEQALGSAVAQQVEADLAANSDEIIVSWWNKESDDHSEIGGVGRLDWAVPDKTVITVSYHNDATTQEQIDESIRWTLAQEL